MRGKVVVVTGASAGVGRAIARELGRRGASVGLLARNPERLEATRREIEDGGGKAFVVPTDVAEAEAVEHAAQLIEERLGPIDVWINNAMATVFAPVADTSPQEFLRVTEVTYLGAVYGTLSALRRMKPRNSGHIIQVGSVLAHRAIPLQSAYSAAKHALRGFTDALRSELLHDQSDVLITTVHLPGVNTPQFEWGRSRLPNEPQPVPPIYQPEVAARAVASVIGKKRREVMVGVSTLRTVWANKLAPGLLDWYLAKRCYERQQTDIPVQGRRRDNLFRPVAGDFAARGPFDGRARERSAQTWATLHKSALAGTVVGAACAAAVAALSLRALR